MIGNEWDSILEEEFKKEYFIKLMNNVRREYNMKTVYPRKDQVFNAFRYTPYNNVKVVILGQDPYHGEGEAEGLSFSVPLNIKKPPSLVNIFKELEDDLGYKMPNSGSLHSWAKEGVLLLNAVLTVIKDQAASHQGMGWEIFTDYVNIEHELHVINYNNADQEAYSWNHLTGLIWQLSQFVQVNIRSRESLFIIRDTEIIENIYLQYKDSLTNKILEPFLAYTLYFMDFVYNYKINGELVYLYNDDILTQVRKEAYDNYQKNPELLDSYVNHLQEFRSNNALNTENTDKKRLI